MGYPTSQFIDSVDDNLLCGVCSGVLQDAVLTDCGHSFCAQCLATWIGRPGSTTCPACRSTINSARIHPVRSLRNLIVGLRVVCQHADQGCGQVASLERMAEHIKSCPYMQVDCAGCGVKVKREFLADHQLCCDFVLALYVDDEEKNVGRRMVENKAIRGISVADKLNDLSRELQTMKHDLAEVRKRNKKLHDELINTRKELEQKQRHIQQIQNIYFDPDYEYGYAPGSVAKLSGLLARFLNDKPSYIEADRIFEGLRRCYEKFGRGGHEYEDDAHMLLATANASNWFNEHQKLTVRLWLVGLARYRQCSQWLLSTPM